MNSLSDYKLDSNVLRGKLQTTLSSGSNQIPKKTSDAITTFQKKIKPNHGASHWSTYRFEPSDRLGRLRRLKNTSSAQDLRNLIVKNKFDGILPPCCVPNLSYCLLCGSPAHTSERCNPNHRQLKYLKDDKASGGSTSRSVIEGSRQWSIDVNTLSMLPLSKSNTEANDNTHLKESLKVETKHDTSLNRLALPLVENDLKKNCRIINDEVRRKHKQSFQLKSQAEIERNEWESRYRPTHQLLKNNRLNGHKSFPLKNEKVDVGISKTKIQQGAQMRFQARNCYKPNNFRLTAEENDKYGIQKNSLLDSNTSCLNIDSSSCDESSMAIIIGSVNGVETNMLLDTGSSISAITESFAQQLKLETWFTRDTLVVTLANTHIERYPERTCLVTLKIGDLETFEELNVLPDQIYNITLGKSWLKRHKVVCDYGRDLLQLPNSRPIRIGFPHILEPLSQKNVVNNDDNNFSKSCRKRFCKFLRF